LRNAAREIRFAALAPSLLRAAAHDRKKLRNKGRKTGVANMQWTNRRQSSNVEDQRGGRGGGLVAGGGIGTLLIAAVIYFMGGDPRAVLQQAPVQRPAGQTTQQANAPTNDTPKQFVAAVLADTEDVWQALFQRRGARYVEPKIVLFEGQVRSACGVTGASAGPFYCPADQKLYIDFSFYEDLKTRYRAPGDFAQAYVIAHEVGHHVQNLMGTMDKVQSLRGRLSEAQSNNLSVRTELQADFYAGVWAHYAEKRGLLDPGDIEEALTAASAIGDDRLQKESKGYAVPDSFTHGSSEQRLRWFMRGYKSGDIREGDTFSTRDL
jgi:predicted metalloprotease